MWRERGKKEIMNNDSEIMGIKTGYMEVLYVVQIR